MRQYICNSHVTSLNRESECSYTKTSTAVLKLTIFFYRVTVFHAQCDLVLVLGFGSFAVQFPRCNDGMGRQICEHKIAHHVRSIPVQLSQLQQKLFSLVIMVYIKASVITCSVSIRASQEYHESKVWTSFQPR